MLPLFSVFFGIAHSGCLFSILLTIIIKLPFELHQGTPFLSLRDAVRHLHLSHHHFNLLAFLPRSSGHPTETEGKDTCAFTSMNTPHVSSKKCSNCSQQHKNNTYNQTSSIDSRAGISQRGGLMYTITSNLTSELQMVMQENRGD